MDVSYVCVFCSYHFQTCPRIGDLRERKMITNRLLSIILQKRFLIDHLFLIYYIINFFSLIILED